MGFIARLLGKETEPVGPTVMSEAERQMLETEASIAKMQAAFLQESLAELQMELENRGWQKMYGPDKWEFTREFVINATKLARMMYFKNPLIKRTVSVQGLYTFALGVTFKAEDSLIQKVIDDFWKAPHNKAIFGDHVKRLHIDASLATDGQLFFVLFPVEDNGTVVMRTLPLDEITDIVTNPNDKFDEWFYKREWVVPNEDPNKAATTMEAYYPRVGLKFRNEPATWAGKPIRWESPVYHAHGPCSLHGCKWSMPEVYAQLDWAMAYKNFLQDWLTTIRAYSRVAMKVSGLDKTTAGATRRQMQATNANDGQMATAGQTWLTNAKLEAVKTAGATTSAEEGRPVKLMVASGGGLPETFYGDADVGNFATSETLDRPTELSMKSRQSLWKDIIAAINAFVLETSARYGRLSQAGYSVDETIDPIDNRLIMSRLVLPGEDLDEAVGPTGDKPKADITVTTVFPDILERNVDERVRALVGAFTMNGRQFHNMIDDRRLIAETILEAIGFDARKVQSIVDRLYPPGSKPEPIPEPVYIGGGPGADAEDDTVGPTGKKKKPEPKAKGDKK